jgi:type IV secretory pathway VirB10-like protein
MFEIASAEEQIALFKLITDKVWQSLADEKRKQDEQAAEQRRRAAMSGGGRAKRSSAQPKPIKPLKPIKPVPVAPPPKPQPIQPPSTQPTTPMSFANDKSMQTMSAQSLGLADERIAAYPQQRQQSAILPIRLR